MPPATVFTFIDAALSTRKPSEIVIGTVAALLTINTLHALLKDGFLHKRLLKKCFAFARRVAAPIIRREVAKAASQITFPTISGVPVYTALPSVGVPADDVVQLATNLHNELDIDYKKNRYFSGTVYHGGREHTKLVNEVMEIYQWTNPLHSDVFGAVRKMEAEIVAMVVSLYHGECRADACGALTTGGTESIGMAMKSYRDWGRQKLGIEHPSVVLPITAHPAFDKAAQYYGMELVKVPVGDSGAVDPVVLEGYIRSDTVAIVGSAPTFPTGTVDPIDKLSDIALRYGIGLHVDACLGGFIVPFLAKAGFSQPIVDFRNPGVTTISCDSHKYGFAPKGTSVLMYSSKELRMFHFFAVAEWPGGIYCSPGASGSRAGNVIAGSWAALISMGEAGYVDSCRRIVEAARTMIAGITALKYLRILGTPVGSVFAFSSDLIDIFAMHAQLKLRGWVLNPLQFPSGIQFSVTLLQANTEIANKFVQDVNEVGNELMSEREAAIKNGSAPKIASNGGTLYGSQQRIPDRSVLNDVMKQYLNGYCSTDPPTKLGAEAKENL